MRTLVEGVLVLDLVQEEGDLGGQVVEACAGGRERQSAPPSSGTTGQKASDSLETNSWATKAASSAIVCAGCCRVSCRQRALGEGPAERERGRA